MCCRRPRRRPKAALHPKRAPLCTPAAHPCAPQERLETFIEHVSIPPPLIFGIVQVGTGRGTARMAVARRGFHRRRRPPAVV